MIENALYETMKTHREAGGFFLRGGKTVCRAARRASTNEKRDTNTVIKYWNFSPACANIVISDFMGTCLF